MFRLLALALLSAVTFLCAFNQNAQGCDPTTQTAFNAALVAPFNPNGFAPTNYIQTVQNGGCCGSSVVSIPITSMQTFSHYSSRVVGVPAQTYMHVVSVPVAAGYGGNFNINARRGIRHNNFGFAGGGFAPSNNFGVVGVGNGGSLNINARRIKGNNINGAAAAAAAGANVNINARRGIRRNNF